MDFVYRAVQLSVETRSMEPCNPVMCTSQYRANFFSLRNLHAGLSDFTQPPSLLARSLVRTKKTVVMKWTRERSSGEMLGKYSRLFQRVLSAIGRSASRREGKSVLPPVRLGIVDGISTGQYAGFVFLPQFPPARPVAYRFGSILQRGGQRVRP